jgi:carbon-monoxide dehydrogenase large subunit
MPTPFPGMHRISGAPGCGKKCTPGAPEIPEIELIHLEYPSPPRNPLGIKGVGEGGAIAPPAAMANAVEDALRPFDVCVRETPLSPERVHRLMARSPLGS